MLLTNNKLQSIPYSEWERMVKTNKRRLRRSITTGVNKFLRKLQNHSKKDLDYHDLVDLERMVVNLTPKIETLVEDLILYPVHVSYGLQEWLNFNEWEDCFQIVEDFQLVLGKIHEYQVNKENCSLRGNALKLVYILKALNRLTGSRRQ